MISCIWILKSIIVCPQNRIPILYLEIRPQFFSDEICMPRTVSRHCYLITDRETCLTSTESRNENSDGVQIFGSNCHWCPDGPCTSHNGNRCEPEPFLVSKGVNSYETCMKSKIKLSKRAMHSIPLPFIYESEQL